MYRGAWQGLTLVDLKGDFGFVEKDAQGHAPETGSDNKDLWFGDGWHCSLLQWSLLVVFGESEGECKSECKKWMKMKEEKNADVLTFYVHFFFLPAAAWCD